MGELQWVLSLSLSLSLPLSFSLSLCLSFSLSLCQSFSLSILSLSLSLSLSFSLSTPSLSRSIPVLYITIYRSTFLIKISRERSEKKFWTFFKFSICILVFLLTNFLLRVSDNCFSIFSQREIPYLTAYMFPWLKNVPNIIFEIRTH